MSHSFQKGDFVKTSKGKIGVIVTPEKTEIGYLLKNKWICLESLDYFDKDYVSSIIEKWQWSFPFNVVTVERTPNLVKLGDNIFPIWSDKLVKLEKLNILVQQGTSQYVITLPIKDAKLLMDIYSRNNIWYSIS